MLSPGTTLALLIFGPLHPEAVNHLLLLTQTPLTETVWLVFHGQHPDQLALCPSHRVPFKDRYNSQAHHEQRLFVPYPVKKPHPNPPPPPSLAQPRRTKDTYFFQKPSDVRNIYSLDYRSYLYNRLDLKVNVPAPCQQHTRCETVEMPRARNSPWQILNCEDYKNLTPG